MELTREIDGYCERLDPSFWAEPVNAVTNAAFVLAALAMWGPSRGLPLARALCLILAVIGVGSFLFHTFATVWAALTDVIPIALFVLLYIYVANRAFWEMRPWVALLATGLFFPFAALTLQLFRHLPLYDVSAGYMPVPLLIALYAAALWRRAPETARGLAVGAGILMVSLTARSLDLAICEALPLGTHFLWHVLNAVMLGWMIRVYVRHESGGARAAPVAA